MTYALAAAAILLLPAQAGSALPDTTRGRIVREFIDAFNNGTEGDSMKVIQKYGTPAWLERLTPEERSASFNKLKTAFGKLTVSKVVTDSPAELVLAISTLDAVEATWTFSFEEVPEPRLSGIAVRIPQDSDLTPP